MLRLHTLKPAKGSKPAATRVGRGIGSGFGKTCGKGHKGYLSRSGASRKKPGFEGGQMPLQRRLPKYGFRSRKALITAQVRLSDLNKLTDEVVDLAALEKANIITNTIKYAKVFASGELTRAVTLKGIGATKGARAAIEAAGGKVEE